MSASIESRVRDILQELLNIGENQTADDNARLRRDLECDSIDLAEIAMSLEEEFNIAIDDDRMAGMRTIGDLIAMCIELGAR